jgi:hypothetical protein
VTCDPPSKAHGETGVGDALGQLAALKQGGALETFATDASAPRGTYAGELHQFRLDLDAFRGKSNGGAPAVKFERASDLLGRTFPPTPWLVRGILPEDGVLVLAGEPKSHKTFAALDLAIAVATGTRGLAQFETGSEKPRAVAAFLAEDSPRSVRARLCGLARGRGLEPAKALEHVFAQCRGSIDIGTDEGLCGLGAAIRMLPEQVALCVLDPFRDLHRGEEDKSGDMSQIMGNLRALRSIVGCSVLLVHHMAKASKETSGRRAGQRMRGSSAIHGAIDGGIYFAPKDSQGGTSFTNSCEVELKAAKGAGRFVLTLTLKDDLNGEVEHAAWKYENEELVVPDDGVQHLEFMMHNEWIALRGASPRAMTKNEIRVRMQKGEGTAALAIRAAESKGIIRQHFQGKKASGYVYVPPDQRAPAGAADAH